MSLRFGAWGVGLLAVGEGGVEGLGFVGGGAVEGLRVGRLSWVG